ncbi:MAG: hypothetical protein IJQ86_06695 [Spirochaetia bacterium]|nr:hypothetical protein [Spirochaetia bacterium]
MSLEEIVNNLPLYKAKKTPTQRQLDKHGPGFQEIPVFVPADIEKSREKEQEAEEKEEKK